MQSNLKLFIIKVCMWRKDEKECGAGWGRWRGREGRERENTNTKKPSQSVNLAKKYKDVVTPGTGDVSWW